MVYHKKPVSWWNVKTNSHHIMLFEHIYWYNQRNWTQLSKLLSPSPYTNLQVHMKRWCFRTNTGIPIKQLMIIESAQIFIIMNTSYYWILCSWIYTTWYPTMLFMILKNVRKIFKTTENQPINHRVEPC